MAKKEKLNIDCKKHVEYLPSTKKVLIRRLRKRFGRKQGAMLWKKTKRIYEKFVNDMPYTGGSKNSMAYALYDSIACFAYWEAMPEDSKETVEEFRFVGDKSREAMQSPVRKDEKGFLINKLDCGDC